MTKSVIHMLYYIIFTDIYWNFVHNLSFKPNFGWKDLPKAVIYQKVLQYCRLDSSMYFRSEIYMIIDMCEIVYFFISASSVVSSHGPTSATREHEKRILESILPPDLRHLVRGGSPATIQVCLLTICFSTLFKN
jgi:hypothetical protein